MTAPTRRSFLISTGAVGLAGLTAACRPEDPPNILSVTARAQPGMNRSGGADVPVTVQVLQLSSPSAFEAADYIALQSDPTILGADLVRADRLVLAPGGTADLSTLIQPGTSVIGITAGFREPSGRAVRRTLPAPTRPSGLVVSVGPAGLSVASV